MILLIGGEKGGTGKSTIATNLAAYRVLAGKDVLLLDTDRQATATFWSLTRDADYGRKRVPCLRKTGGQIHRELEQLRKKFDDIIIDAGGRDSAELRSALLVSDKFYMPLRPSQFDVWTVETIGKIVEDARIFNPGLKTVAFLNLASANPRNAEIEEVGSFLRGIEFLELGRAVIRDRISFRRAGQAGLSVFESNDSKAKAEMQTLCDEVYGDEKTT